MIISTTKLPSKGFNSSVSVVEIPDLTYGSVLHYMNSNFNSSTVGWLLNELELLPIECNNISGFDILPILSIIKFNTIKGKTFIINNQIFEVTDIKFTDMTDKIKKISKVGDLRFRVPLIKDIKSTLASCDKNTDFMEAILACYLCTTVDKLMGLNSDYIGILNELKSEIISLPYVVIGGEEIKFSFDKISDLFLLSLRSEVSDSIKIEYNEVPES